MGRAYPIPGLTERNVIFVVAALLLSSSNGAAGNPQCDSRIRPVDNELGYKERQGRCEGLYEAPISSSLTLVAIMIGALAYEMDAQASIALEVPHSTTLDNRKLHIRGVGRYAGTYYQVDTIGVPGEAFVLPIADVILPSHLSPDKLGFFCWYDDTVPVHVPLRGRISSTASSNNVRVTMRADASGSELFFRISAGDASAKWTKIRNDTPLGEIVTVDVVGKTGELHDVEFRLRLRNSSSWDPLRIRILVP